MSNNQSASSMSANLTEKSIVSNINNVSQAEAISLLEGMAQDPRLSVSDLLWLGYEPQVILTAIGEGVGEVTSIDYDDSLVIYNVIQAYLAKGVTPFPTWIMEEYEAVVLVDSFDCSNFNFAEAMFSSGIALQYATSKSTWVNGKKVISYEASDMYLEEGATPYCGGEGIYLFISSNKALVGQQVNGRAIKSVEHLYALSVLKLVELMSNEEKVDLLCAFGMSKIDDTKVGLGISKYRSSYHQLVFNFEETTITGGREFKVRAGGFLSGFGSFDASSFMVLIGLELGTFRESISQSVVDGKLAFLTQLWEEEDVYGQVMDANQQLRVVRENTWSIIRVPMKGESKKVGDVKTYSTNAKFPYFKLWNNNSKAGVDEATAYCLANNIGFMVDKNAMKRITVGAGVAAYYGHMDVEGGVFTTFLDVAKAGKLLNRGSNAVAIAAMEGLDWQEGYTPYVDSAMQITYKDEVIVVKGDRKMTLSHDGTFLTNGSGVGISNTTWAFSVPQTLRGTLNAINLRKGELITNAAAEMQMALADALSVGKVISNKDHDRTVFEFRGRKILSAKGLNRSIYIGPDVSVGKVKCLATSSSIGVTATVRYFTSDTEPKVRGIGIKASLKSADATGFKVVGESDWEVALNSECLKGSAARIMQYCEYLFSLTGKVSYLNTESLTVTTPTGENGEYVVEDMNDMSSGFYQWWAVATKEYVLEDTVDFYYFCFLVLGHAGVGEYQPGFKHTLWPVSIDGGYVVDWDLLFDSIPSKLSVVGVNNADQLRMVVELGGFTTLRVQEEVRGVMAPYVFQVELASVRECSTGGTSGTLQQLTSVYLGNPGLAYALLKDAPETEKAILGMVASALNDPSVMYSEDSEDLSKEGKSVELVSGYKITPALIASRLNTSTFGMSGPRFYTPNSDPVLEFSKDCGTKFEPKCLVNRVGLTEVIEGGAKYTFQDVQEGTSWNYQVNVGTGYNMASISLVDGAIARYAYEKAVAAGNGASAEIALAKLKLTSRVAYICWITSYEDAWLAGYNPGGMALAQALHEGRRGAIAKNADSAGMDRVQIVDDLIGKLKDISGIEFSRKEVDKYLFYFQTARAISQLERYDSFADGSKAVATFGFGEEHIQFMALAGAFRRCDQGSFANYVEAESEGNEGSGSSIWTLLAKHWDVVQNQLPYFLRRKIYLAMCVHSNLAQQRRDLKAVDSYDGGTALLDNVSTVDSAYLSVPVVTVRDVVEEIPYLVAEDAAGAFDYLINACPLGVDGLRDMSINPVKTVKLEGEDAELLVYTPQVRAAADLIKMAAKRYPLGLIISSGEASNDGGDLGVYLNFDSLLGCSAIMGGDQSTGLMLQVAQFIIAISRSIDQRPERNFGSMVRNQISAIQGAIRGMMSSGLLRRIGRTKPNAQGGKVRTSHNCADRIIDGVAIPVVRMNPSDDLVRVGKYFDGCYVSISRTPQIAEIYAVLELSDKVHVGYVECSAIHWALSNRGDGDGDGCNVKNLSSLVNLQ